MSAPRLSSSALVAIPLVALVGLCGGCPAPRTTPGESPAENGGPATVTIPVSLAEAAAAGDAAGVAGLLADGADPTELDGEGRPPLEIAIAHPEHEDGNLDVLTALAGALRALENPHPERRPTLGADGVPEIDLNTILVKLLWYDPDTLRPTDDPASGVVILKVGTKVYPDVDGEPDWALLQEDLVSFRDGYRGGSPRGVPIIVGARPHVPDRHVGRALAAAARAGIADVALDGPWNVLQPMVPDDVDPRELLPTPKITNDATSGPLGQRWRKEGLAREGGSEGTEASVHAALRWLERHQSPDGRWDADGWKDQCAGEPCAAGGGADASEAGDLRHDAGLTGLALLAFLANGQTHRFGAFKRSIHRGVKWLKSQQKADGSIGFIDGETIYGHAFATAALCEAYALSKDFSVKSAAQKAVDFCIIAQNPGQGWKYGVKPGRNDTGVTVAMLTALHAARNAGFDVPSEAFDGARSWLDRATATNGSTGYQTPGGGSSYIPATKGKFDGTPVNTAAAIFGRVLIIGQGKTEDVCKKGARIIAASPPSWPTPDETRLVNFYYWHYGTLAMFQLGGAPWREWNDALLAALLDKQRMEGDAKGSWDPDGEWCIAGGRVYATAINALTLETYYRYERKQR